MNSDTQPVVLFIPSDLKTLSRRLEDRGIAIYLVGGAVRDAVLGFEPDDYDLATEVQPDTIVFALLDYPGYKVLEIGKAFGVITVITPEGGEYQIATFRRDVGEGRRPESVEFTSIEVDVARRDFTINALFYNMNTGKILDFVGGITDLKNGVVKTVGNPIARFREDRLRILRAIRFCSKSCFALDEETSQAIKSDPTLTGISGERIRAEFMKGLEFSERPEKYLNCLADHGLMNEVFPGFKGVKNSHFLPTNHTPFQLVHLLGMNERKFLLAQLNKVNYTGDEVAEVGFFYDFRNLNPENAARLKRQAAKFNINDVAKLLEFGDLFQMERLLVAAFVGFKLNVTGEALQAEGFCGKQLGAEMERREQENFLKHYNSVVQKYSQE